VFDEAGKVVYAPSAPTTPPITELYRLRKTWEDAKTQAGAFSLLENAKKAADEHAAEGYKVFNSKGEVVYTPTASTTPTDPPKPPETPSEPPKDGGGTNIPPTPKHALMGQPEASVEQAETYLHNENKDAPVLAQIYKEEADIEGIRWDIAFAQSIKETGFFKFGGDVPASNNNFAGLGATGGVKGASFATPREGIRAQIQHLKAYASTDALKQTCVDPRYNLVTKGICPNVEDLNGHWAVPGVGYGESIMKIVENIKAVVVPTTPEIPSQGNTDDKTFIKILIDFIMKLLEYIKKGSTK
jgi:hypothetical protein